MEVLHKSKRQIRKQVPQVLSLVGITDKATNIRMSFLQVSSKEWPVARAIINNPTVLIADEATGKSGPDNSSGDNGPS